MKQMKGLDEDEGEAFDENVEFESMVNADGSIPAKLDGHLSLLCEHPRYW